MSCDFNPSPFLQVVIWYTQVYTWMIVERVSTRISNATCKTWCQNKLKNLKKKRNYCTQKSHKVADRTVLHHIIVNPSPLFAAAIRYYRMIVDYDEYGLCRFWNAKRTHINYKAMEILQQINIYLRSSVTVSSEQRKLKSANVSSICCGEMLTVFMAI